MHCVTSAEYCTLFAMAQLFPWVSFVLAFSIHAGQCSASCVEQNFCGCCTTGCVLTGPEHCACDQACYEHGDCCDDIMEIYCFPNSTQNNNCTQNICTQLNYSCCEHLSCVGSGHQNCCTTDSCYVASSLICTCYCDEGCYSFNDCCDDIKDVCPENSTVISVSSASPKATLSSTTTLAAVSSASPKATLSSTASPKATLSSTASPKVTLSSTTTLAVVLSFMYVMYD